MKFEYEPGLAGTDTRRPTWWNFFRRHPMQLARSTPYVSPPGTYIFQDRHARKLGAWVQNPETGDWYDDGTGTPAGDVPGSGALPSTTTTGPADWLGAISGALPKISAFLTAEQLAQVNIDRAKKGLPALQTSQYAPQVGVGL